MTGRLRPSTCAWVVAAGLALGACSRPDLTAAGSRVAMVDAPMAGDCDKLGVVRGESGGAGGVYMSDEELIEHAVNDMRNKAAARGATHLYPKEPRLLELDGVTNRGVAEGMAFRCGKRAAKVTAGIEARIREALDAHAEDILACVGKERVAVRVDYAPDAPLAIGLQGDLAGTPEQSCVVSVLHDAHVDTGGARGTFIHIVRHPKKPAATTTGSP